MVEQQRTKPTKTEIDRGVHGTKKRGLSKIIEQPNLYPRSCITRANFRLAKLEKAEFTLGK